MVVIAIGASLLFSFVLFAVTTTWSKIFWEGFNAIAKFSDEIEIDLGSYPTAVTVIFVSFVVIVKLPFSLVAILVLVSAITAPCMASFVNASYTFPEIFFPC